MASKKELEAYLDKPKSKSEEKPAPKEGEATIAHRIRLFEKLFSRGYSMAGEEMSVVDRLKCFDELVGSK